MFIFLNRCLYLNKICVEMITHGKKNYAAYQYFIIKHGGNSDPCTKKGKNLRKYVTLLSLFVYVPEYGTNRAKSHTKCCMR